MEPKFVQVPIPRESSSTRDPGPSVRPVSWICLPYFVLERYSGLLSGSGPASFPPQTLLQAEYSRYAQDRDMLQAVCHHPNVPAGFCFHVAQLWCIVLDNSLLVTYGAVSATELRDDAIKIVNEPMRRDSTTSRASARIYVAYSDAVLWSFRLDECRNWFVCCCPLTAIYTRPIYMASRQLICFVGLHLSLPRLVAEADPLLSSRPTAV